MVRWNLLLHSFTNVFQGTAPSLARISGDCFNIFTTLRENLNDSSEVFPTHGICYQFFSIGINTGASGRTFAEIVCLYGTKFSVILSYWNCFEWDFFDRNSFYKNIFRLGHHGLLMQAILPGQFGRAGDTAFFELEQDRCLYPWEVSETAAQLENLIPNFSKEVALPLILLLMAHPLPISRGQDASFQEAVFANMYCLQFAEISVTYLTSPRLMTTQDFGPSPLTASSDL